MNPAETFKGVLKPGQILAQEFQRLVYSYDASNLKGMPSAVLLPSTREELAACLKVCARQGIAFVARGAGTNLAGASVAPAGEVVISLTRLNRLSEIDSLDRLALAECGVVNLDLQKAAARQGLFFAPDPASQKASTLGGNLSQNSGGPHCLKYGITTHHVGALELLLADGTLLNLGHAWGEVPGPDLRGLVIGSEGCLGVITRAWLRLLPVPASVRTAMLSFPDVRQAVEAVSGIIEAGIIPATLELMDRFVLGAVEQFQPSGYPSDAGAILVAEVDGEPGDLVDAMGRIESIARRHGCSEVRVAEDDAARARLWEGRRGAHAAVARLKPSVWVEDGTVPRNRLAEALERLQAIARRDGLQVGYLFHAGDGNFHPLILFDDRDRAQWEMVRKAGGEMLKACVDLGGSITGEHGVGLDKLPFMEYQFDPPALQAMAEVKLAFDPGNRCNPGKMIPPPYVAAAKVRQKSGRVLNPEALSWAPASQEEAVEMVLKAGVEARPLRPLGGGTKSGRPGPGVGLSLRGLKSVLDFDPANLTLEAEAGLNAAEAEVLAGTRGLTLGLGFSFSAGATLGGVLSCNDSGPWKRPLRDSLLGMNAVLPDGRLLKLGRKVVKNVAGLDLAKCWVGARGSFGLCTRLILKLHPRPPRQTLFVYTADGAPVLLELLQTLRKAGLEPAAHTLLAPDLAAGLGAVLGLPFKAGKHVLFLDLEGPESGEASRREKLAGLCAAAGLRESYVLEGENREEVWAGLGRMGSEEDSSVWRLWRGQKELAALATLCGNSGLPYAVHAVTGELRLWISRGEEVRTTELLVHAKAAEQRISVLKGNAPASCWWEGREDVKMARKLKDHFDPDGLFPEMPLF